MVFYDDIITFFYQHEFQHVSVVIRSSYKDANNTRYCYKTNMYNEEKKKL